MQKNKNISLPYIAINVIKSSIGNRENHELQIWPSLWDWPIPSHVSLKTKTAPNNWCFRKRTTSSSGSGSSPARCQLPLCLSQWGKTQITMSQSNIEVPSLLGLHMHIDMRSTCTAYTMTIWGIKIQYSVLIQGPWTWECSRYAFLFSHSPPQWWWILLEIFWSRSLIGCMTMSTPIQCGTLLWTGFARHNNALSKQHITSDSSKFPGDIIWHLASAKKTTLLLECLAGCHFPLILISLEQPSRLENSCFPMAPGGDLVMVAQVSQDWQVNVPCGDTEEIPSRGKKAPRPQEGKFIFQTTIYCTFFSWVMFVLGRVHIHTYRHIYI